MPSTSDEDTIVVKGGYGHHRLSSPDPNESTSTKDEPLGLNSLATPTNIPQNLESSEASDDDIPSIPNNISRTRSKSSRRTPIHHPHTKARAHLITTMEERLTAMPIKRALPWRPGVEAGAEIETGGESRRKQIRFGCLLATRGDIAPVPCNSCATGRGKFDICVALEGYFKGACASCQLSGRPNRCSIKQNDDVAELSRKETDSPKPEPSSPAAPLQASGPRSKKRRRTNTVPEVENLYPKPEYELADPNFRMPMNEIVPVQGHWVPVNPPVFTPTPPQAGLRNGIKPGPPPPTVGWAAVNQPPPFSAPPTAVTNNGHRESVGNSPGGPVRQEGSVPTEDGSSAWFDKLPKTKQRQVYGVISGLEGGIQHLQRELTSLKKALGIDEEE